MVSPHTSLRTLLLALLVVPSLVCGCGNDSVPSALPSLPAGVTVEELHAGTGPLPVLGQTVTVSYTGTLTDGTKFDSSVDRGQDLTFRLGAGQVITGLESAIARMKVGTHAKVTIPPEYAYGSAGSPPKIPGNATLIFDVWLSAAS